RAEEASRDSGGDHWFTMVLPQRQEGPTVGSHQVLQPEDRTACSFRSTDGHCALVRRHPDAMRFRSESVFLFDDDRVRACGRHVARGGEVGKILMNRGEDAPLPESGMVNHM